MKSFGILAITALLTIAAAAPIAYPVKRDIVVVTEEVVVEEMVTVFVDSDGNPVGTTTVETIQPKATPPPQDDKPKSTSQPQEDKSKAPEVTPTPSPQSPPPPPPPQVETPMPKPAETSAPPAPKPDAPVFQQQPSPTPTPAPPAYTPPPPPPPPPPAPAPAPKPAPAPSPAPPPPAPPATTPPASSGGSSYQPEMLPGATISDDCTEGKKCSGEMTFYNPSVGMGACGPSPVDGHIFQDTEDVVAVIYTMMGTLSSRDLSPRGKLNPLCFRRLKIYNPANGKSAIGQVVDKCPGCRGTAGLDLSPSLFNKLADSKDGIVDMQWHWV